MADETFRQNADTGKSFDDAKYAEIRRQLEGLAGHSFADYVTIKEVAEITHSTYGAVYYALRAKIQLHSVKHGVQHFILWEDARAYATILRERRMKKAKHMSEQAFRIEKKAARRLKEAKLELKRAEQVESGERKAGRPVPGEYDRTEEEIAEGDLPLEEAAKVTGYTKMTLSTYATPSYHLVDSYIVGNRRIIPKREIDRLRERRQSGGGRPQGSGQHT